MVKKKRIRRIHFKEASPWEIEVDADKTTIEFFESYDKRAIITMKDWQVNMLVRKLSALPVKRTKELQFIKDCFSFALDEVKKVNG